MSVKRQRVEELITARDRLEQQIDRITGANGVGAYPRTLDVLGAKRAAELIRRAAVKRWDDPPSTIAARRIAAVAEADTWIDPRRAGAA